MPIKITVEESDDKAEKTTLQTPNGKSKNRDNTTLQTPKGTENEELPPAEPLAIPDDDELKPVDTIVIKDGETYKNVKVYEVKKQAKEQEGVKCQFCKGTGKVIVEKKGIKECPRCEGDGYTTKPQADLENHKDDQQIDDITQEEEIQGGIQPETEEQIEQDNSENEMEDFQEEQEPEDLDFGEPEEEKVNTKAFESFVGKKIQVLKQRHPDKAVTLLMGTEVNGDYGSKKIKGTLAYAGVSLNDRIYLPEELAKGDGMTLPLLLNHSSTAGAEGELYRLQEDARQSLERGQDYKVGEVTLTWKPEALTLYYEGEVDNPFFQKEVDEADMAVSLGIYYDSDSPMLCNDQCYTVIKGAEFREVSLVYHAGFPVATIEAYEKLLKKKAMESMKGEPNINPEKANEDLTFAGYGEIDSIEELWNQLSHEKRYWILHDLFEMKADHPEGYIHRMADEPYSSFAHAFAGWDLQALKDYVGISMGESKASEVNYDYNEIKGGGTWVEYHGYDGRTGKPDGSVKKGKAWLKGPAGWVVGNGSSNTDFVDESNFISSESKANELSPEAQCPKCGSYKTILEGKSSLGYGKRRQYACLNCYNIFQSEHSPKEIRAMYGDHNSPYDRNRWGESKADEDFKEDEHPRKDDGKFTTKGGGSSKGGDEPSDGDEPSEKKRFSDTDVWISNKTFGMKARDDGGLSLTLDDGIGWRWSGDETSLINYVTRVAGTEIEAELLKELKDSDLSFDSVKNQMLYNLENEKDELYAVSGDNSRWRFGEGTEIDMGIIDDEIDSIDPDLTPEQRQQVKDTVDEFAEGGSYEGFMESDHGGKLKDLVEEAIQNSNSFEDLFFYFRDEQGLGYDKLELQMFYNDELTRDAIYNAVDSVKNKKGRMLSDLGDSVISDYKAKYGGELKAKEYERIRYDT